MDVLSSKDQNYQQPSNLDESWGHSEDDEGATDDEQEDLPYDGILECYLAPSLDCDLKNNSGVPSDCSQDLTKSLEESLPNDISIKSSTTNEETVYSLESISEFSLSETISKPSEATENIEPNHENVLSIPTIIPDVLLRHFNEDTLLNPYEFIDYETMPEVSIAESSDATVISRKSCTKLSQNGLIEEEVHDFGEERLVICQTSDQEDILINEVNSDTEQTSLTEDVPEYNQGDKEQCELATNMDKEVQHPKQDQERRLSSSEIKYGQGQVHYKLPDFSKVPPKVKIPKGDAGNVKPVSSVKKATPASNLSGRSFVIQDILESMQPFTEHELIDSICSDHLHVQISHYALDSKDQITSEVPSTTDFHRSLRNTNKQTEESLTGLQEEDGLQACKPAAAVDRQSQNTEDVQLLTEGEKMSRMLTEQVQQLKNKVFQNLRSCLESLELNYLSSKDKHRNLQLQTYRTGCQTVGEFDLEREVEGQIYRLGMLLEDIQEQINKNAESLTESSPSIKPHDASVSTHAKEPEDVTNVKNCLTEKDFPIQEEEPISLLPCLGSLNSTASNPQIPQQESPVEKNGPDHSLCMETANATDIKNEMVVTSQEEELIDLFSCSTSLNNTASNTQIPEPPLLKNGTDKSHLLNSLTSPRPRTSKSSYLSYKSMTNSPDQLAKRHTYVTTIDNVSPAQNLLTTNIFPQSNISQRQNSTVLHCSELSGKSKNPEKKILEGLKSGIDHNPLFHTRYHEADLRKIRPVSPGKLSICIQKNATNVEIPVGNKRTDSFSSNWMVTSHSRISKCRHQLTRSNRTYHSGGFTPEASSSPSSPSWNKYRIVSAGNQSKLLNQNTSMTDKALHKQKLYGASSSRISIYSQNQISPANQLDVSKYDLVRPYRPISRCKVQSSSSRHSHVAAPAISNLQRRSRADVKESPLDYMDFKILNSALDQTLRTAKKMQKTTEKMIQKLTADLVNSPLHHSSCTD